jgi:hypothetical protein
MEAPSGAGILGRDLAAIPVDILTPATPPSTFHDRVDTPIGLLLLRKHSRELRVYGTTLRDKPNHPAHRPTLVFPGNGTGEWPPNIPDVPIGCTPPPAPKTPFFPGVQGFFLLSPRRFMRYGP